MHAQLHTACFSLKPQDCSEACPFDPRLQGILADAVSPWPTLDCGPRSLSPAAVRQAWVASLAPVFDKPQHSH